MVEHLSSMRETMGSILRKKEKRQFRAKETAQWLRAFAALVENLDSVPRTHGRSLLCITPVSEYLEPSGTDTYTVHLHT